MQLNELLESNTLKMISSRTNISEDSIDALTNKDFERVTRVKLMGFLSILEREYDLDLSSLRDEAIEYYTTHQESTVTRSVGMPITEKKKGRSKWFVLIVIAMIIYAIWYAFNYLEPETIENMLPFSNETISNIISMGKDTVAPENIDINNLSIEHVQSVNATTGTENTNTY